MKNKGFVLITALLLLTVFFTQFKLINHTVNDNDEGIYLTSFLLVDKGNPAYKKTFFSQPPGFLLSVYPGFTLFGKTLQSARFTVGIWSLIGILAVIWINYELKNKWAGLLTVSLLLLVPSYYNQSLTFQSDVLILTFSLLSLAALIKFGKSLRLLWFIVSVLFLNLAFWTKYDITFFPSFILFLYLLFKEKKISKRNFIGLFFMFLLLSLGFFIFFISPYGIKEIFNNTIMLRFQAATDPQTPFILFEYIKKDVLLSLGIIGSLFFSLFNKRIIKYPSNIFLVWTFFVMAILIFYRPLFPHHLVMLTVPMMMLFSQSASLCLNNKELFKYIAYVFVIVALVNRIFIANKTPPKLINSQQQQAVDIIKKYANSDDMIVSDEAILYGLSGRLPPSELSDISRVRIRSNNLTPESFKKIVDTYKPRLIISWNGRLELIKNFSEVLASYRILNRISDSKKIYIKIDNQ